MSSPPPEALGENGTDVSVLTVDDHRVFREAARDVIEATAGFKCVGEAGSGDDALAMVEERRPELVLVDVRMPGMDGIELTRRIKRAHPELVVVLISIEEQSSLPAEVSTSGAEAFLRKQDFGPSVLQSLWVLHGRRASASARAGSPPP